VKQASHDSRKTNLAGKAGDYKTPGGHDVPNGFRAELTSHPDPKTMDSKPDPITLEQVELDNIKQLPKEVGVMLITAGIVGFILPGPGTPAIIAGGLVLWPKAFGKLESWLERRHPEVHRQSMQQIGRFLNDLEKRYPYSTHG
jgi:hypothetical protein